MRIFEINLLSAVLSKWIFFWWHYFEYTVFTKKFNKKNSNCSDFTIHESCIYSETTECNMWCTILKHYYFKRKLIIQTIFQSLQAPLYIKYISSVLLLPFSFYTLITNAIFACTQLKIFLLLELLIL